MLGNMGICDLDQEREADWALCRIVPCETRTSAALACMPEDEGVIDPDSEPDAQPQVIDLDTEMDREPDPRTEKLLTVLEEHPQYPPELRSWFSWFGDAWRKIELPRAVGLDAPTFQNHPEAEDRRSHETNHFLEARSRMDRDRLLSESLCHSAQRATIREPIRRLHAPMLKNQGNATASRCGRTTRNDETVKAR